MSQLSGSNKATFTQGSTFKHVTVMTATSAVGLMTLFIVDLIDMFFLSLLGEVALAAAIGYAGTILFFTTSISIGIAIATGAMVSRAIGQQDLPKARRFAINSMVFGVATALVLSAIIWWYTPLFLDWLGATDRAHELATRYLRILIPSMALLTIGMSASSILRAAGDAKRAMYVTVAGGLINLVLDPILIFVLDMGIAGAAWASVAARVGILVVALHGARTVHNLIGLFRWRPFFADCPAIAQIALPAMLTNVATPIGNAYVMATIAQFGDSAVAGMSIISRLIPVAFGVVFALSGAVGPIVGQNYGAEQIDRVRQTVINAALFATATVTSICVVLFLLQDWIVDIFNAQSDAAALIHLFATWVAVTFVFNGFLFIANAAFNNLGYPHYSTGFNFLKATVGTIPFVYAGAHLSQQSGALIGQGIGAVLVGSLALMVCFKVIHRIEHGQPPPNKPGHHGFHLRFPRWSMSSTRG